MQSPFSYKFYRTSSDAWEAMYLAINSAKKSVYWEVYILVDDVAGNRFIDAICAKALSGIDVKIIIDGLGSFEMSREAQARLRGSGVKLYWYNKLRSAWRPDLMIKRLWYRDHRKVLIIDEDVAFVGGVNVDRDAADWYDLHVRLTGKVVRPLLRAFALSYARCGGDIKDIHNLLHPKLTDGIRNWQEKINCLVHSPYYRKNRLMKRFYLRTLGMAQASFNLVTPYYVPDKNFLRLIYQARRRGTKVNIILPWRPDHKIMQYIAQAFYDLTQKAGASVYLLRKMNHAKAISCDNMMGMIGSANLTPRSFMANEETGVCFYEQQMVNDLNAILDDWKLEADPLSEIGWQNRGWTTRFKEWWASKISDFV